MKLCTPAHIYLIIQLINLTLNTLAYVYITNKNNLRSNRMLLNKLIYITSQLIFIILWTQFLNWICSKGFVNLAWFIFLLPVIFTLCIVIWFMKKIEMVVNNELIENFGHND